MTTPPRPDRLGTLLAGIALALTLTMAAIVAALPILFDTLHVTDTTFMAQLGRWVLDGSVPGIDFDHFYGGMHEWFVAQGLRLSGGGIKAIDHALVLEVATVAAGLAIIAWRRLDAMTLAVLILLCAILIFARVPLEEYPLITRLDSAHSFGYNRLGTALTILIAAVVLVPARRPGGEIAGGLVAGVAAVAAMLAKSTFFPVALVLPLALILTGRWRALIAALLAMAGFWLLTDPTGARIFGTLSYSLASAGAGSGESWLLRKAIRLILTQQMQLFVLGAFVLVLLARDRGRGMLLRLLVAAILLTAFWATSVTMGPAGLPGHQSGPLLAAIALLLLPRIDDGSVPVARAASGAAMPLAAVLCAMFMVPHLLNFAGGTILALRRADRVAFESGPLQGYVARGDWRPATSMRDDPDATVRAAVERLTAHGPDATTDYIRLIDAVTHLRDLPGIAQAGIVSDTQLGLGFALGARRVEGFPVWLREDSRELAPGGEPMRDVDIVLLSRPEPSSFVAVLRDRMGEDFTPCAGTPLWEVQVRRTKVATLCPDS